MTLVRVMITNHMPLESGFIVKNLVTKITLIVMNCQVMAFQDVWSTESMVTKVTFINKNVIILMVINFMIIQIFIIVKLNVTAINIGISTGICTGIGACIGITKINLNFLDIINTVLCIGIGIFPGIYTGIGTGIGTGYSTGIGTGIVNRKINFNLLNVIYIVFFIGIIAAICTGYGIGICTGIGSILTINNFTFVRNSLVNFQSFGQTEYSVTKITLETLVE